MTVMWTRSSGRSAREPYRTKASIVYVDGAGVAAPGEVAGQREGPAAPLAADLGIPAGLAGANRIAAPRGCSAGQSTAVLGIE